MAGKNYVDPLLTNVSKGFRPLNHINEMVCPEVLVNKDTGKVAVYGADNLRIVSSIKAPAGETPKIDYNISTSDAWVLEDHELAVFVADTDIENEEKPFDGLKDGAELVSDLLSVSREYSLAGFMASTSNITNNTTLSGTAQWGQSADAPIADIQAAIASVSSNAGVHDSQISLILPQEVFRILSLDDDITDLHKYSSAGHVSAEDIAKTFGVKQVLVPNAIFNSAAKGQTDTIASVWGKHAWATFIPERPSLKTMAFGYTVRKRNGLAVDKWYDNDRRGFWVRAKDYYDQYIMQQASAYLIKDAIA